MIVWIDWSDPREVMRVLLMWIAILGLIAIMVLVERGRVRGISVEMYNKGFYNGQYEVWAEAESRGHGKWHVVIKDSVTYSGSGERISSNRSVNTGFRWKVPALPMMSTTNVTNALGVSANVITNPVSVTNGATDAQKTEETEAH